MSIMWKDSILVQLQEIATGYKLNTRTTRNIIMNKITLTLCKVLLRCVFSSEQLYSKDCCNTRDMRYYMVL